MNQFKYNENPMILGETISQAIDPEREYREGDSCKESPTNSTTDLYEMKPWVKNPLEILEILEIVMKNLRSKYLFQCRKVCKLWDEAAVRALTGIPYWYTGLKYFETQRLKMEPTVLANFNILLNGSHWPQLLFKNIFISSSILPSYNLRPIDIPQVQNMLRDLGKYVKNLEIEDGNDFDTLSKCVGPNGFCPNVQMLEVVVLKDEFSSSPLGEIGNSKLKHLMLYEKDGCGKNDSVGLSTIFNRILKTATTINVLCIKNAPESKTTNNCVALLQTVPHITKNMKVLQIQGNVFENMEALCKINFENLKMANFHNFPRPRELLRSTILKKFLQSVSKSLLSFDFDKDCTGMNSLPLMPKLKEYVPSLNSSDPSILKRVPSLRVLKLYTIPNLHEFLKQCMKPTKRGVSTSVANFVPKFVHDNLERIEVETMYKFIVDRHITIQMLNTIFPNLRQINIQLNVPQYYMEGQKTLFEGVFHAMSQMKHLKKLVITVGHNGQWEYNKLFGAVDLTLAFSYLKASRSMETMMFRGYRAGNPNYTSLTKHLQALIGAPKLHLIELPHFPVMLTKENKELELEWLDAVNQFALSNIILKVGQSIDNFRVSGE